ncbi:MAG: ThuA domain-containing protein [Lentisphaeria bacterium]|nr:ThuA domain-containing protein [Lentisphaeria bacterium]
MNKALIFRGGWAGHDPVNTSDMVAEKLRSNGVEVDIFDSQECLLDPDLSSKYSVIIPVWTMGELISGASQAIEKAVRAGVGIAGWHGGMCDAFRNDTSYQFITGGQWVAHPGNIIDYEVEIVSEDPIVQDFKILKIHSEQYYMHVDPSNEVLATTRYNGDILPWINGTVMPVIWKRKYGEGKVFYCAMGHTAKDFQNTPEILEIIVRGILWAMRD